MGGSGDHVDRVARTESLHDPAAVAGQTLLVGAACGADITFNYPMWLVAKRISAGLSWPNRKELYKGAFTVWLSIWPTTVCEEDFSYRLTSGVKFLAPSLGKQSQELAAAAAAGAISGLVVAAPIENIVTRAHATGETVAQALRSTVRSYGLRGVIMPFGMTAMMGREVPFTMGIFAARDSFANFFHGGLQSASAASSVEGEGSASRHGGGLRWWAEELACSLSCATTVNLIAHPPATVLAVQQAHAIPMGQAIRQISASGLRGFYSGFGCRCLSLGGSFFVVPTVLALGEQDLGVGEWFRRRLRDLDRAVHPAPAAQLHQI